MRSPSVMTPTSLPSSTTGTPEIPDSAKSLMVSSTVCSGPRVGQSVCIMSPTLSSRISCWFTDPPADRPTVPPGTPVIVDGSSRPHEALRPPLPLHGFYPCSPATVELEIDERAAQEHPTPGRNRELSPLTEE